MMKLRQLLRQLFLFSFSPCLLLLVDADKLDDVLASGDLFPATSPLCTGAGSQTSFRTSYTSTYATSQWVSENNDYEPDVFEIDMIHKDTDDNRDWSMRIGKGGQIASFIVKAGEAIANQANDKAAWNDLVQQMVAVHGKLNSETYPNFIHQAGPYMKDSDGMPPPFYSPKVALHCSANDCITVNWGQQAHIKTPHDSPLLYYTRYRDCGNGVIEYDMAMHHFGQDATDVYDYFNTPWTGVRTSTFQDVMLAKSGTQELEHIFPLENWGAKSFLRNMEETGGFTTFAEDLELAEEFAAFDFSQFACVQSGATVPCDENDPNSEDWKYEVQVDSPAAEQAQHAINWGLDYVVSFQICPSNIDISTHYAGWGHPPSGVLIKNDKTGYAFQSDSLIHFCHKGASFMGSNVTAAVLNEKFHAGDKITVTLNTGGKPFDEQQGFTFVHGTNPEYYTDGNIYRAKARVRWGTTSIRRDGTVWTTNWQGYLSATQTYFNRKYLVIDKLDNTVAQAGPLSDEAFEKRSDVEELPTGRSIRLYKDDSKFGFSIGGGGCSTANAYLVCTGSSLPIDGGRPWFYITCGSSQITTSDPYHYTVFETNVTDSQIFKRSHLCVGESTSTRPEWKLLGFFAEDCADVGSLEYEADFCPDQYTAEDGYFCPEQNYDFVADASFACAMSVTATCDAKCAQDWCTFLNGGSSTNEDKIDSGKRKLTVAAKVCDAGFAYDWDARICFPIDECLSEYPCSLDYGSYCVNQFPEYRYECGCRKGFEPTAFPVATTTADYNGVIMDAFIEQAISETGVTFNYTVPIKFRPISCFQVASDSPSASTTNGPSILSELEDFSGDGGDDDDDDEFEVSCENFGRPCTKASEYCGLYRKEDGILDAACLCNPGMEKALGDPYTSMRGCVNVDKCNSPHWNRCSIYATCHDDFPGTAAAVRCDCQQGYEGGGGFCQKTSPPTPAPTTLAPVIPLTPTLQHNPDDEITLPPKCVPRPCTNDCGLGSPTNTCRGCNCICDEGATLASSGMCMANRPGASFDRDTNQCVFAVCPNALEYIQATTNDTHTTCVTLTRDSCNQECAETRCTNTGGRFIAGSPGNAWDNSHSCSWDVVV